MPLSYARGHVRESTGTAGSAFSKGDLLQYNASSQLSRYNALLPTAAVVGVAMADSTESLNGQVPYILIQRDTVLWSDITNAASAVTPGQRMDAAYIAGYGFLAGTSTNSPLLIVDAEGGQANIVPSTDSRVRVMIDNDYLVFRT